MSDMVLSVAQLNGYIKGIFDAEELLIGVKVAGEITNYKKSGTAIYFDLKDELASIPCVCFDQILMEDFSFGDKVVVKGKLNFYTKAGRLSFVVSKIEKYGLGDLYKQYIELKNKLEKEGLFDDSHKILLPQFPKRVGVVSSDTGAVIRDIIRVARTKNYSTDIVLYPAKVQGLGSIQEIVSGIKFLDNYDVDVIIVARGGGSFEDYQPFNSEEVARAVYECETPIVSAIGHENDWTIIDFVADRRGATPSVASEIVFFDEREFLKEPCARLYNAIKGKFSEEVGRFSNIVSQSTVMSKAIESKIGDSSLNLKNRYQKLPLIIDNLLDRKMHQINVCETKLNAINPNSILNRGYAKLSIGNKNIMSVEDVLDGDNFDIRLADGRMSAKLLKKEKIK